MWFELELRGQGYKAARAGVAVSIKLQAPTPLSGVIGQTLVPCQYILKDRRKRTGLIAAIQTAKRKFLMPGPPGGQMARDMNVFVDDDCEAYHIFSAEDNGTLDLAELNDDYTGHTCKFVRVYQGHQTEALALFKHNGIYYLTGSDTTGWAPNAARWLSAPSIWAPWTYHGNPCHGGVPKLPSAGKVPTCCLLQVKKTLSFL